MTTFKEARDLINEIIASYPERIDDTILISADECFLFNCFGSDSVVIVTKDKILTYEKSEERPRESGDWAHDCIKLS